MNRRHRYEPLVNKHGGKHGDSIRICGYSSIIGYLIPIDDRIFLMTELTGMWTRGIIDCRIM